MHSAPSSEEGVQAGNGGEEPEYFTVAVVSDLHAYAEAAGHDPKPSFLSTTPPNDQLQNPMKGLERLIAQNGLSANLLLCGGDLAHAADPAGVAFAWDRLQELKQELGAGQIIATAGNHDVDSRPAQSKFDAKGRLQELEPLFPIEPLTRNDQYWSRHFALAEQGPCRVLTLNSCAYHGFNGVDDEHEHEHGRVADRTVARIRKELETLDPLAVNILLCHHHPDRFGVVDTEEASVMKGGDRLLTLLKDGQYGRWTVIHGHKHYPHLDYGRGGAAMPVVLAAGSLCARPRDELGTHARNQFYLLTYHVGEAQRLGLSLAGTFKSWRWEHNGGWLPSTLGSGLPHTGGFGFSGDTPAVARRVADAHAEEPTGWEWSAMALRIPELQFLIPGDVALLATELESSLGYNVELDQDNSIRRVIRP